MSKVFYGLMCVLLFLPPPVCCFMRPQTQNKTQNQTEDWLNEKYALAQKELSHEEVDILKQEDQILLRLKKLSFPANDFKITRENLALLTKLQKIIGHIQPHQISIEGHTDSFEGKKISNKTLSFHRALAVQSHLIAHPSIDRNHIGASGWKDIKPIASNQTAAGRARNRRVDIIISANTLK